MLCTFGMPWCLKDPKDVLLVWPWVCCYGCLGLKEVESGIAVALNALKPAPHHALWSSFTDFPWSLLSIVSVVLTLSWAHRTPNWTSRSRDTPGERSIRLAANWCKKLPFDGAVGENADMSLQHSNKPLFGNYSFSIKIQNSVIMLFGKILHCWREILALSKSILKFFE